MCQTSSLYQKYPSVSHTPSHQNAATHLSNNESNWDLKQIEEVFSWWYLNHMCLTASWRQGEHEALDGDALYRRLCRNENHCSEVTQPDIVYMSVSVCVCACIHGVTYLCIYMYTFLCVDWVWVPLNLCNCISSLTRDRDWGLRVCQGLPPISAQLQPAGFPFLFPLPN